MPDAPYALALTAGMLAAVNPCGFALLPAYLSLLVVGGRELGDRELGDREWGKRKLGNPRLTAVTRALGVTAALTVGFVAVFGVFGLLTGSVADLVSQHLPWLSLLIGLGLAGLGGWLLAGRELPLPRLGPGQGPELRRRLLPMVAFGASYAIASLGCTIGPFLAVVASAFRFGTSLTAAVALFVTYAVGMAAVTGTVALAVALADASLVQGLRRAGPVINRLGGAVLIVAGLYVAWYGWYELRVFTGADTDDPVIDAAARVQSAVSTWLSGLGPTTIIVAFCALLAAAVAAAVLVGRRRASR